MGLEQFTSEEKTSSPNKSDGPSKKGIEQFLDDSEEDEIEIEGGFTIPNKDTEEWKTEVVKIFGGPGTGKTTTMVGNTDIENFQGILQRMFEERNPEEVMLIAYTRAAADEAKERLVKLTDISESRADDRITTIHSLAMRFNSLRPKDIVEIRWANDKYNFCDSVGLEYNMNVQEDDEQMMDEPDDEGHLFFRINSWLKSKLKPADEWIDCPLSSSWERSGEEFVEFAQKWEEFKNEKNIWEFDDVILESVNNEDVIDTKFLFVDEVQDLYPLQQAFLDNHFGKVKRIFLAGDDDQTIYEWAGAKPEYFLDMEGKVNEDMPELWEDKTGYWESEGVYILDQSWRMPDDILELSKMCIEKVDNRQDKSIKPHHEGGKFIPLHSPMPERVIELINPEDTMILFRAKYQMNSFQEHLIDAGIPFRDRFKTWRDGMKAVRDGLASLKDENQEMMGGNEAQRLAKELPDRTFNNPAHRDRIVKNYSQRSQVKCESFVEHFRYSAPTDYRNLRRWTANFRSDDRNESLNYFQQKAIRNNMLQDNEHLEPDGIQLETIHSAKGREADTIVLSLDSTQSVQENIPVGKKLNDAERRLYYVGMTRSENRLVVCQDLDDDSPTVTLDELLGAEWRDMYDWANGPVDERRDRRV